MLQLVKMDMFALGQDLEEQEHLDQEEEEDLLWHLLTQHMGSSAQVSHSRYANIIFKNSNIYGRM